MNPRIAVIIPARLESTRLPRKLLRNDTGMPLIQHTYANACRASLPDEVIVAADSQLIIDALQPYGTRAVLTSPDHKSGTDRIAEAAEGLDADIIINVQGDEPELDPDIINRIGQGLLDDPDCPMISACSPLPPENINNPDCVKTVINRQGYALYFSRAPIPYKREADESWQQGPFLHLGLYGYRRGFLKTITAEPQTPLEQMEKLEQLRVLENGYRIRMIEVPPCAPGIDTAEDYEAFTARIQETTND